MNTYKLVKTYPGAPKLGTVAFQSKADGVLHYQDYSGNQYSTHTVEDFPEFWEKVNTKFLVEELADDGSIKKIKRLADGVRFAVGDYVRNKNNNLRWKITKIFSSICGGWLILQDENGAFCPDFSNVIKVGQALVRTVDGVDKFEGDWCYYIDTATWNVLHTKNLNFTPHLSFDLFDNAKKYIIMNKPCLSLNNVVSVLEINKAYQYHTTTVDKLKKFIEENSL